MSSADAPAAFLAIQTTSMITRGCRFLVEKSLGDHCSMRKHTQGRRPVKRLAHLWRRQSVQRSAAGRVGKAKSTESPIGAAHFGY